MSNELHDIPVFKTFIYNNRYYLYDTSSNQLLSITEDHYIELNKLKHDGITNYRDNVISRNVKGAADDILWLIEKGLLQPNNITQIEHSETKYIYHYLKNGVNYITLQVTKDCNFSCRYCVYASSSGIDRNHEKIYMTKNHIKKAIDFLYDHSRDARYVRISFYGGEPLLNFEGIRDAVNYSKRRFVSKNVKYNMTSNGSLLSDDIVDFLVENNFDLAISLDGPAEIQNKHRKFMSNGENTFSIVYSKVLRIKERYPNYFSKNVSFSPVMFHDESTDDVYKFFSKICEDTTKVNLAEANLQGIDYTLTQHLNINQINNINDNDIIEILTEQFLDKSVIPSIWHHNGPCVPGMNRLFINVIGDFYPCEKLVESNSFKIGSLESGFDYERIKEFMNIGRLSDHECKRCWAKRFCKMCISNCYDYEKHCISRNQKLTQCKTVESTTLWYLKYYIDTKLSHKEKTDL